MEDEIYMIKQGLEKFDYFKKNPNEFHFIEVVTKEKVRRKTGKVIEEKRGLDELFQETLKVSSNTIMAPIMKKISEIFNESSIKIIENFPPNISLLYPSRIHKPNLPKINKYVIWHI